MEKEKKVDKTKVVKATALLQEMMDVVRRFDETFKTLTLQEKHLVGGIVFRIRNVWNDFSLVGIMADRNMAREMIDMIVNFYQNPEDFTGFKEKSEGLVIKSAQDGEGGDDFAN